MVISITGIVILIIIEVINVVLVLQMYLHISFTCRATKVNHKRTQNNHAND